MIGFPLLLIPLAIYNIIAFLMPDVRFGEPLFKLALMSGDRMAGDAERRSACARHPAAAVRSHQGRASRREIFHRPSAVADRVRRGRGRIRAVAEIRHLDLFPADGAGAGGFPVRPCPAQAARRGGGASARVSRRRAAGKPSRKSLEAVRPHQRVPRRRLRLPNPCLPDHPQPTTAQPAIIPDAVSPEVPSPGLQPGSGAQPSPDSPPR